MIHGKVFPKEGLAMNFYPIDLKNWPRAQMFLYFSQMAPTGYSITVSSNSFRKRWMLLIQKPFDL